VFFGAWDPEAPRVGLTEQLVRRLPAAEATPAGDFRDWPAIDAWSAQIARELLERGVAASPAGG
jgi:menaquinone-dependent protoporphyrinogen oxidase